MKVYRAIFPTWSESRGKRRGTAVIVAEDEQSGRLLLFKALDKHYAEQARRNHDPHALAVGILDYYGVRNTDAFEFEELSMIETHVFLVE